MINHRYLADLRSLLHPAVYPHEKLDLPQELQLLLTRKKRKSPRYALAVTTWDNGCSGGDFLTDRRRAVSRELAARWMFAEVGLYLVVLGTNNDWRDRLAEMHADRTGFHATIVQGVHYVNIATGDYDTVQSAWGPLTFGNAEILADLVASVPMAA
ncbi:hypothetical protein [Aporhodopirellula aestuarii]|uniref:Uncharacterized protein n=1 Tax=Aporhodopirellula aestuarii TaxID=2950107 RepID=A0ABT0UCK1_9BACT|nr:hypothetical protein [Aporhodopirellula aestuarii]MCM2374495.1 hypothetical protein [Aporhodopirellula aestuarii]